MGEAQRLQAWGTSPPTPMLHASFTAAPVAPRHSDLCLCPALGWPSSVPTARCQAPPPPYFYRESQVGEQIWLTDLLMSRLLWCGWSISSKPHVSNVIENQIPKQVTLFKRRILSFPLSIDVQFP